MPKARARTSLLDDVLAKAQNKKPGFRSWIERLPEDARAELEAVRQSFNPAIHRKRTFAFAVMQSAKDRGWETSGVQGVLAWLNEKR